MVLQPVNDNITKAKATNIDDKSGDKSRQLTLGEKKLVASADTYNVPRTDVNATVNGSNVPVDNATNLNIAKPDDDIKQMLAQLQGPKPQIGPDGIPITGTGTVGPDGIVTEQKLQPMTAGIVKGMLFTVYMIPSYIYRVEYKPDQFTIDIKGQQLADILERYGVSDVKYLDLLFFGAGVVGDMAGIMGKCKELKEEKDFVKKLNEEKRIEEAQWKGNEESRMLKDGLTGNRLSEVKQSTGNKKAVVNNDMVNAEGGIQNG